MGIIIRRIIATLNVPYFIIYLYGSVSLFANVKVIEGLVCLFVSFIYGAFVYLCYRKPNYKKIKNPISQIHDKPKVESTDKNLSDIINEKFAILKNKITGDKNMLKCPECKTENTNDTKYCKMCGINLVIAYEAVKRAERENKEKEYGAPNTKNQTTNYMVQCPKCYEINAIDSHFCKWCGLDLTKEKILRKFSNGAEIHSEPQVSTSKTSHGDATAIKIAAILIFIDAGIFALITLASIWYTIAYQANFDVLINSWNVIMTIFSVFVGIEVIKKSSSGYSKGLYMNGIGVIWYGYQAIASSWTLGYFLAILCGISFFLIKTNSGLFAKAQKVKK